MLIWSNSLTTFRKADPYVSGRRLVPAHQEFIAIELDDLVLSHGKLADRY